MKNVIIIIVLVLFSYVPSFAQGELKSPEPEVLNAPYWISQDGSLINLERQNTISTVSGLLRSKMTIEIQGENSRIQITEQRPRFLLKIFEGTDPTKYELYKIDVIKGKRTLLIAKEGTSGTPNRIPLNVVKVGDYLYTLIPANTLSTGEYGIAPAGSTDVFCFFISK